MFDAVVVAEEVVERLDAAGLWVTVVSVINDMTVPKGIVGKDKTARTQYAEYHFVGVAIGTFVTVDESHVESDAKFWCLDVGVANDEADAVGDGRLLETKRA